MYSKKALKVQPYISPLNACPQNLVLKYGEAFLLKIYNEGDGICVVPFEPGHFGGNCSSK